MATYDSCAWELCEDQRCMCRQTRTAPILDERVLREGDPNRQCAASCAEFPHRTISIGARTAGEKCILRSRRSRFRSIGCAAPSRSRDREHHARKVRRDEVTTGMGWCPWNRPPLLFSTITTQTVSPVRLASESHASAILERFLLGLNLLARMAREPRRSRPAATRASARPRSRSGGHEKTHASPSRSKSHSVGTLHRAPSEVFRGASVGFLHPASSPEAHALLFHLLSRIYGHVTYPLTSGVLAP